LGGATASEKTIEKFKDYGPRRKSRGIAFRMHAAR
jgi:hypothetical protein